MPVGNFDEVTVDEFKQAFIDSPQQETSLTIQAMDIDNSTADKGYFDKIKPFGRPKKKQGRNQKSERTQPEFERRRVTWGTYPLHVVVDNDDKYRLLKDPTSDILAEMRKAEQREIDYSNLEAITGTAYGYDDNKSYSVKHSLAANWKVGGASGANTNIDVDKLIEAKRLVCWNTGLANRPQDLFCFIDGNQAAALLRIDKFTNSDYNQKALMSGEVVPFLGMRFVVIGDEDNTGMLKLTSNIRDVVLVAKGAAKMAVRELESVELDKLADQNHDVQASIYYRHGATRIHDNLVCTIKCDETK